jgi:Pvc16 N-terminal domain
MIMSSNAIISEVSSLLKSLLEEGLVTPNVQNPTVELANPADETAEKTLSIWLYQVTPSAYLRNAPNVRTSDSFERFTPLSLDLCYLLTPSQKDETANQQTLGRALQVLYDNSILTLASGNDVEELHLSICQRSITELAEVWEALQRPYRLSVCFEVRTVQIDSERTINAGRVRERATDFQEHPTEAQA